MDVTELPMYIDMGLCAFEELREVKFLTPNQTLHMLEY